MRADCLELAVEVMVKSLEMVIVGEDFGMRDCVLASSSTGNDTVIETPGLQVLVDAGLTGQKIEALMKSIGRDSTDVDSVFNSHEHSELVRGVGVLARRYPQRLVYANAQTFAALHKSVGQIPEAQLRLFDMGNTLTLGDLDVESFGVSHDAAAPLFYTLLLDGQAY